MSKFTVKNMNRFLLFKIPSAYFTGVRVSKLTNDEVESTVKYKWASQNPFKSIYWAVQGMASELTTGILVMKHISDSNKKISMLVTHQTGDFYKKAVGKITFSCKDGKEIANAVAKTIATKEGQTFNLTSEGFDEKGDKVSSFMYQWSIKAK
ncbi:MAG TPA: DUF4442 domain-containing protein [Flavobacteriaceae bacterium]|nr:DUF4442 domain-containing protein [Flavobacteriaceae bacterium]